MAETTNVEAREEEEEKRKNGQLVASDDNSISYTLNIETNYPTPDGKLEDKGSDKIDNSGARDVDIVKISAYDGGYPEKQGPDRE